MDRRLDSEPHGDRPVATLRRRGKRLEAGAGGIGAGSGFMIEITAMTRFLTPAFLAAAALLGISSGGSAWAQSCRDPDPDPLRAPIRENQTPFHLTVENVRSNDGNIVITLYGNDPDRWLRPEGSLHIYTVPARASATRTCIVLPGLNQYAIAVYHDKNGNGRIDRNFIGVPTEDGGLSNNPSLLRMVWPSLPPSLITVNGANMARTIRLRQPPI